MAEEQKEIRGDNNEEKSYNGCNGNTHITNSTCCMVEYCDVNRRRNYI